MKTFQTTNLNNCFICSQPVIDFEYLPLVFHDQVLGYYSKARMLDGCLPQEDRGEYCGINPR